MSSIDRFSSRPPAQAGQSLADILERILDKGLVVAGDIQVNLADVELLTIKIRLLLASADTARSMGIDWWEGDPFLNSQARQISQENRELRARLYELERLAGITREELTESSEDRGER
jgi:hypothetical protein